MKRYLLVFALLTVVNVFAQVKPSGFSQKSLQPLNEIIQKRFAGRTQSFAINEYVAFYAEMSQYLAYSNLKTNKTGSIRLDDSLLYSLLYNKEQIAEIEEKMVLHKKVIDEYSPMSFGALKHGESHLRAFCFYGSHIYILYNVMNFYGMKTLQSEAKQANAAYPFYHEHYLVELIINDSNISKGRTWNLLNEEVKSDIHGDFSIIEDQPALFFKTTVDKNDQYDYIILNRAWDKKASSLQTFPAMMSKYHSENNFYNGFTLNSALHILINNQTREKMKILPGSFNIPVYSGYFIPYKNAVYARIFKKTEKTYEVFKIDLTTKSNTVVKTFKDKDLYPFHPVFYIDQAANTLYIIDINDAKQFYIVDSIKL